MASDSTNLKLCRVTSEVKTAFDASTPASGSIYWDETEKQLVVGDGETVGGFVHNTDTDAHANLEVTATGSTTARALADRFADVINVKDYGAIGNGVMDDTAAIQAALASGEPLLMPDSYAVSSQVEIPAGSKIHGDPTFIMTGTDYRVGLLVRSNCTLGCVTVKSTSQLNSQAVSLCGSNIHVDHITVRNINRGIEMGAGRDIVSGTGKTASGDTHYSNIYLGGYDIDSCVQGLKVVRATDCVIGEGKVNGLPESIDHTPVAGNNAILIAGSNDISFGDLTATLIPEHCVRIGGDENKVDDSTENYKSHDLHFGNVISYKHGGSAFKNNPGYHAKSYNISANNIISIDAGMRNRKNIRRLSTLRISFCDGFDCNSAVSRYTNPDIVPSETNIYETDVVELEGCNNIDILNLSADVCGRSLICFHEGNDDSETEYSLETCSNVSINNITCNNTFSTAFYLVYGINTGMSVSDIKITNAYVGGDKFSGYFYGFTADNTSNIFLSCFDATGKALSIPTSYVTYHSISTLNGANVITAGQVFDKSDALSTASLALLGPVDATATGYGRAIVFSRLSSNGRPGAGIAMNQFTAGTSDVGLSFFVGASKTSTNSLRESWQMTPTNMAFVPASDNTNDIGSSINRVGNLYCASGTIDTSDEREKSNISDINEEMMRAWGNVNFKVFQFKDALVTKGAEARLHVGVIAQQVIEAFASEGLDASRYGLLCHDAWDAYDTQTVVVDREAILDEEGHEIEPEVVHTETVHHEAGDRYGIRYEEALALECAYQRWELNKIKDALNGND